MRGQSVHFRFNADPLPLKSVTQNKIVFRPGMGSCLPRLKCKWNARCVAVTDSFVLINVSTMKARCLPVQFMSATEKETKNDGIIKKLKRFLLAACCRSRTTWSGVWFYCWTIVLIHSSNKLIRESRSDKREQNVEARRLYTA